MWIVNCTQAFKWYHLQWPWATLSDLAKYSIQGDHSPDNVKFSDSSQTLRDTPAHVRCAASLWQLSFLLSINQKALLLTLPVSSVFSAWSLAVWADMIWMQWRWYDSRPLEAATSDVMSTLVVCTSVRCRLSLQHMCNKLHATPCRQNKVNS